MDSQSDQKTVVYQLLQNSGLSAPGVSGIVPRIGVMFRSRFSPSRLGAAVVLASSLGLVTLGLAACAADESTASGSAGAGEDSGEVQPLALVAETTDGGQFEFGSLEGQDAVLWFWAPW